MYVICTVKNYVQYYNMNKSNSSCIIIKRIELEIMKSIYFKMVSIIEIITLLNENILSVANTMFINHSVLQ